MDDGSIKSRFDVPPEERLKAMICVERIPLYDFEKSEANRLSFASFIAG
ncbi:hypothetical protein MPL1032_10268 [Mesorhizobium plurifarium]|uniref:Uncharacterized protein n=1 Tax=Mesorhizobium plurifarium TaxID=69974 RepID=A0A0K2VMS5_MESPL|nr:hypothetical protein MPL1032_10268 [Mesorhizobium plurifarium]